MDGPNQGLNLQVHKVDESHQGATRSTKRADLTRGQTYITPKKRTDPTDVQNPNAHNGRTKLVHKIIQVHKVDGHQGSRPHSTE